MIDLAHAALLVSKHDNPDLDVQSYRQTLSEMAADLSAALPDGASQVARLQALRNYLFTENGFHGSRTDYYNRANSYLNQVLDDREGLPITLSILFLELAGRIGLQGVEGLPLPGHFMVKFAPAKGDAEWIDVFDGGKTVSRSEAQERVLEATGEGFQEEHLKPAKKREIIVRMVRNLQSIAERSGESGSALHYLDLILALNPESAGDRLSRVRFLLQRGDKARAQEDVKWLLENNPPGVDLDRLSELYRSLGERESQ
jgi:serine protease Do